MELVEIRVKVIGKPEVTLSICPDESVYVLKTRAIEMLELGVDPSTCCLLLRGVVLNDSTIIKDLTFCKDKKLYLVYRRYNASQHDDSKLWNQLYECASKYFKNPADAKQAVEGFKNKYYNNIETVNIDHIEKIMKTNLSDLSKK